MIRIIFDQLGVMIHWLADAANVSYEEMNVIVFIAFIPTIWIFMIGVAYKMKTWKVHLMFLIIPLTVYFVGVNKLFNTGVQFEHWLNIIGWDYYTASVYTCVVFPIIGTLGLISLIIKKTVRA